MAADPLAVNSPGWFVLGDGPVGARLDIEVLDARPERLAETKPGTERDRDPCLLGHQVEEGPELRHRWAVGSDRRASPVRFGLGRYAK